MKHSLNIYDNITLIKRVISGGYAKPKWSATLEGKDDYFEFEDSHSLNKTYYFIIENWQKSEYEFNITFTIYSTETLTNISSIVQAYLNTYKYTENLTYKFQVPLKHKKYLLIRFDTSNDNYEGNFIIYENCETLISNYSVTNNENYIELKSNSYYIIYFFLIKIDKLGEGAYLFLAQSEYNRYMPVEINTDYFEEYPFTKNLYLLLNLTTIKKGYKMMIEYDRYFDEKHEHFFGLNLCGYNTEEPQIIENNEGNKISFIDDRYEEDICQMFMEKDIMSNYKLVVLNITTYTFFFSDEFYFFQIRYGKQEKYPIRTIFILIGFGLAISFPNILAQIIRCYKKKEIPIFLTFWMDIILHIAYANISSIFINSEIDISFYVGIGFLGLFIIFIIYSFCSLCFDKIENSIFSGFKCLLNKCKNLRTLEEAINERRKLPPKILLEGNPIPSKDEDENKDEIKQNKTVEFEYCTWEDNTNINLNIEGPIINCDFVLKIKLDKESEEDLESFKKDLKIAI